VKRVAQRSSTTSQVTYNAVHIVFIGQHTKCFQLDHRPHVLVCYGTGSTIPRLDTLLHKEEICHCTSSSTYHSTVPYQYRRKG